MTNNYWNGCWEGKAPAGGSASRRARNIISSSGGIVRGKFPSRKCKRMIHYEGLLELDAIHLFESSPLIACYWEQPFKMHYPDGGRLRRYTPDFELALTNGKTILIEVKPTRSLQNAQIQHKFKCIEAHLQRLEVPFVILTDATIRQEPRLSNLRWLYRQRPRIIPTVQAMDSRLIYFSELFPLALAEAQKTLEGSGIDIYSLLVSGKAYCSLDLPISHATQINLIQKGVSHDWFQIHPAYGF
jgi:hypothetical protein